MCTRPFPKPTGAGRLRGFVLSDARSLLQRTPQGLAGRRSILAIPGRDGAVRRGVPLGRAVRSCPPSWARREF